MAFLDDNITFVASKTQDTKNKPKMDSHTQLIKITNKNYKKQTLKTKQ